MIRFLFLSGKTCEEIKPILDGVYGTHSPFRTTVYHWFAEFRRGRMSVFDEPRPGGPKTATTEETVDKIHDLKVRELAGLVGISTERINHILHEFWA